MVKVEAPGRALVCCSLIEGLARNQVIASDFRLCSCERRAFDFHNELLVATTIQTQLARNPPRTRAYVLDMV